MVEGLVVLVLKGVFNDAGGKYIGAFSLHAIQRFVGFKLYATHTIDDRPSGQIFGGTGGRKEGGRGMKGAFKRLERAEKQGGAKQGGGGAQ